MLLCQCQHSLLTLVSSISVHTIQSCVPMCRRHHKGQQSFSLTFRPPMMFTYSIPFLMVKLFLTRNSALPSLGSECSPMHVLSKASLFWGGMSFLGAHPLTAGSQQHILILCFLPVCHMHRCQLEGTPLQCEEFQLRAVVVLLIWHQCSAAKCYRMVASIILLL